MNCVEIVKKNSISCLSNSTTQREEFPMIDLGDNFTVANKGIRCPKCGKENSCRIVYVKIPSMKSGKKMGRYCIECGFMGSYK